MALRAQIPSGVYSAIFYLTCYTNEAVSMTVGLGYMPTPLTNLTTTYSTFCSDNKGAIIIPTPAEGLAYVVISPYHPIESSFKLQFCLNQC